MIGILSSLRAVQHALYNHDRRLSETHGKVITSWWEKTGKDSSPELKFIKASRDAILKDGSFKSFATYSESAIGEGSNREVTRVSYELAYYDGERRIDLEAMIRAALDWCDRELSSIETSLPTPASDYSSAENEQPR